MGQVVAVTGLFWTIKKVITHTTNIKKICTTIDKRETFWHKSFEETDASYVNSLHVATRPTFSQS